MRSDWKCIITSKLTNEPPNTSRRKKKNYNTDGKILTEVIVSLSLSVIILKVNVSDTVTKR